MNERVVKPAIGTPRPNIQWLADQQLLAGHSAASFYAIGDRHARSAHLRAAFNGAALPVAPRILKHWSRATGWSFPSGHATSAFATLAFTAGLILLGASRRFRLLALPIAIWAAAICHSRVILRVHSPLDVTVGALQGALLGLLALLIFWSQVRPRLVGPS